MKEIPDRHCLTCGKVINFGRADRRYCDDVCRARATRKRLKETALSAGEDGHKAIINTLKRNYNLLKKAIGDRDNWIVDFEPLYRKGFNRSFYTSSAALPNGGRRYFCFEIGWEDRDEGCLSVSVNPGQLSVFDPRDKSDIGFADGVG